MNDVAKSYVWHEGKCFFVSTINRESSSMMGGTYAETIVWEYDHNTKERGDILHVASGLTDSIKTHLAVCLAFHEAGKVKEDNDE